MGKQETTMWPDDYYREMDGAKRKRLLDEALANGSEENSGEDSLRLKLWQARYASEESGKGRREKTKKDGEIDYFVKAWIDLSMFAKNEAGFGRKRMIRDVREAAGTLLLDKYASEQFGSLLDREYLHLFHLLIDLYLSDYGFTHRILGLTKLSADELERKVADRFTDVTRTLAGRCEMTELFEPLDRAAAEAFEARFKGSSLA